MKTMKKGKSEMYLIDDFKVYYDGIYIPQISHITRDQYIKISLKTLKKIVRQIEKANLEFKKEKEDKKDEEI